MNNTPYWYTAKLEREKNYLSSLKEQTSKFNPLPDYNFPIELLVKKHEHWEEIDNQIVVQVSEQIGVKVDKEELMKALTYERDQYFKGFNDAELQYNGILNKVLWTLEKACNVLESRDRLVWKDERMRKTSSEWKAWLLDEKTD